MTGIKICGITDNASYEAARGADYAGFVFYPKSPRAVTPEQAAAIGNRDNAPDRPKRVGVFVDMPAADIASVARIARLEAIQLHGDESAEDIAALRALLPQGFPVIKACKIAEKADVEAASAFADIADMLLLDAKPPAGAELPGGNGAAFDLAVLDGFILPVPWFLAGGVTPANAVKSARRSKADFLDVSSSLEDEPGKKNPDKIRDIIKRMANVEKETL